MSSVTITYIGRDTVFSDNLEKEFKEIFEDEIFYYVTLYLELGDYPHTVFPKVLSLKPDLIYIDFSYMPEMMYSVARAILTSKDTLGIPIIGILNIVTNKDLKNSDVDESKLERINFIKAVPTQVQMIHYKGEDLRDIASDGLYLAKDSIQGRGEYACHKTKGLEAYGKCYSKITNITEDHLVVESSIQLDNQKEIIVSTDEDGIFNKKKLQVIEKSSDNIRNNYRYRYLLKILFQKGDEQKESKTLIRRRLFLKWFADRESDETSILKVLIIQNGLPVMEKMEKAPNEYPYRFRFVTHIEADLSMIRDFLPHMIMLDFEKEEHEDSEENEEGQEGQESKEKEGKKSQSDKDGEEEELPLHAQFNGTSAIREIVAAIKKIVKYDPFIKVFSCSSKTSAFQKVYEYPYILASEQELDFDLILNMAKMYEQKKQATLLAPNDDFLKKAKKNITLSPLSVSSSIKIGIDMTLTTISEHEITFLADEPLPIDCLIEFSIPIHMYVTVVKPVKELEKVKGKFHHMGIIHGVTELTREVVRKYVNKLFFIELEEKRRAEQEEFKARQQEALRQKEMAEATKNQGGEENTEDSQEGDGSAINNEDGNERKQKE